MINGDAREFIEGLYYGDERFFCYKGCKYFLQGYYIDGKPLLEMYAIESEENKFKWRAVAENVDYPVNKFEDAPIFDGKTFWQVEDEIEWVDC